MITFNTNITLSDLTKLNHSELCATCRDAFVYDEDKAKEAKYTFNQLRTLFGQPLRQEAATPEADELFLLLFIIYAGGGSFVKLQVDIKKQEHQAERSPEQSLPNWKRPAEGRLLHDWWPWHWKDHDDPAGGRRRQAQLNTIQMQILMPLS